MEEWIKLVSSVGFPVVITIYVLMRLENSMRALTDTVRKLIVIMAKQGKDVNDLEENISKLK